MTTKVPDSMLSGGGAPPAGSLVPTGCFLPFGGTVAPDGWLLCHGQDVSRDTYSALFDVLGTAFGVGDGSTTFGIPDMRGRLPLGKDNMGGVPANRVTSAVSGVAATALGGTGGDQRLHAHNHSITDPGHAHSNGLGFGPTGGGPSEGGPSAAGTGSSTTGISINNAGSGSSQNMPPVLVVNYIIKT